MKINENSAEKAKKLVGLYEKSGLLYSYMKLLQPSNIFGWNDVRSYGLFWLGAGSNFGKGDYRKIFAEFYCPRATYAVRYLLRCIRATIARRLSPSPSLEMAATLSDMPPEIKERIAAYLSPADQRQLSGANRQYRGLFQQKQKHSSAATDQLRATLTSMLGTPAEFNAAVYAELKKYANANDYRFAYDINVAFGDCLVWFEYDGSDDTPWERRGPGYTFVQLRVYLHTEAELILGKQRYNLRMPDGKKQLECLADVQLISSKTFASVLDHLEQHNVQFCDAPKKIDFIDDLCNNVVKRYYTLSAFSDRAMVAVR